MTWPELVIIGAIIVALLLVILWARSWLGHLVEPTRAGQAGTANVEVEVEQSALAREAV